jgi:site-specific DNA recombinase
MPRSFVSTASLTHVAQAISKLHEGQHPPVVPQDLWEQVQQSLRDHLGAATTKRTRQSSDALLAGKLYDDGGNRMSPTWARKESKRWRYYVSQEDLQGDKSKAGSILRVPAADVETFVTEALGRLSPDRAASQTDIRNLIDRVVIGRTTIRIQLSDVAEGTDSARILTLPWTRPSPYRKREIIQGANHAKGLVTLATKERDASATLEISSSRDCLAPRAHRRGAECAMR